MKTKIDFDFLKRLSKAIAQQMGKNCEVVVYDLTKNYENTIVAIENGYVSGRQESSGASELVMKVIKSGKNEEDKYNYFTRTTDGRELKSSSVFIRDENDKPIAMLAINYDITDFKMAELAIKEFIEVTANNNESNQEPDVIPNNVTELLDLLIEEAYQMVGKPVNMMTREDKVKAIRYLEQRGALLIKKSGDKISRFFDISKYTLYDYLSSDDESNSN